MQPVSQDTHTLGARAPRPATSRTIGKLCRRNLLFAATLVSTLSAIGCSTTDDSPDVVFLGSDDSENLALPFSEAVRVGNLLFLSGQVGNLPGTKQLVPGGIAEQTHQTLRNMATILKRHGSSLDHVVKCTVFIADIDEWPAMNEVYKTYFGLRPPARSALGANGLALGARLEIECIAVMPPGN